ncbi:unnamed protein product [Symbiodinium natans]|uniref:Uncharacterized protein n=1 Tax=Symbiodinium natans TaxID=878477 RepID=A0A812R4P2_9DINO|nr:unnamed protein product [Symbiodinium natans]
MWKVACVTGLNRARVQDLSSGSPRRLQGLKGQVSINVGIQEKRSVPLSEEEKEIQGLRNELQTLTEENQSMLEAVKQVREEEANVKKEIEAKREMPRGEICAVV